jgi:hypothetical protein
VSSRIVQWWEWRAEGNRVSRDIGLFCAGDVVARKKRTSRGQKTAEEAAKNGGHKVFLNYLLAFLFGGIIVAAVLLGLSMNGLRFWSDASPPPTPTRIVSKAMHARQARQLEDLLAMPPEQLAKVDIARMNLLCAAGLPGAENLDVAGCLGILDRWAARVKHETERHLYRLTDPRYKEHAEHYKNSEARFRAEWLVRVLQEDVGVHYYKGFDPLAKNPQLFKTSKECFVHGVLESEDGKESFGGNCVSLPVVYAAVGRRLGYPVKLVCSFEHTFCRWEGLDHANSAWRERFNFDGAGNGFSIDPDKFYLTWPKKSKPDQVKLYDWLQSLTPQQELALFLSNRGHVLRITAKDDDGAQIAYAHAVRYWPTSRMPLFWLTQTVEDHWKVELTAHPDIYHAVKPSNSKKAILSDPTPWRYATPGWASHLAEIHAANERNRRMLQNYMQPTIPGTGVAQPHWPHLPQPPRSVQPSYPYQH